MAKATQISPERQQVNRSPKSIDTEINRLQTKIKVYESNHGEREQVVRSDSFAARVTLPHSLHVTSVHQCMFVSSCRSAKLRG